MLKPGLLFFIMRNDHRKLPCLILLLLMPLISGCVTPTDLSANPDRATWKAEHVLQLDPIDAAINTVDMLALYAREDAKQLTLRVDLLDPPGLNFITQFKLSFNDEMVLVQFLSDQSVQFQPASQDFIASAQLLDSPQADRIEAQFVFAQELPADLKIEALLRDGTDQSILDQISPVSVFNSPPAISKTALVFWNVMPASTPAQALRRWDGAHTGPYGQRHGLKHLLVASSQSGVHLILLDALTPNALASLELLGQTSTLRDLQRQGLLSLAQSSWGDPLACQSALELSRIAAKNYNIQATDGLIAGPLTPECIKAAQTAFAYLGSGFQTPKSWNGTSLIPLPVIPSDVSAVQQFGFYQVQGKRLSNAVLSQLIQNTLDGNTDRVLVLGGSLPESLFAEQSISSELMKYIADRPWIEVQNASGLADLSADTIESLPVGCNDFYCSPDYSQTRAFTLTGNSAPINYGDLQATLRPALDTLSIADPFAQQTWLTYLSLTNPTVSAERAQIQANYLGQVGVSLYAYLWAQEPTAVSRCDLDLDWDDEAECVLSNAEMLVVIEHQGPGVVGLFSIESGSPIQWVAPSTSLAAGLGDPSNWKPQSGPLSDSDALVNAFSPTLDLRVFTAVASGDTILFTHPQSSSEVVYQILPNSTLRVRISNPANSLVTIPILPAKPSLLDSEWVKFNPIKMEDNSIQVQLPSNKKMSITGGAILPPESFRNSLSFINQPEDPNQVFPDGHFLPFPMIRLQMDLASTSILEIRLP